MITGYYVRAKVNGHYQSVDIATLSDEELDEFFKDTSPERAVQWAKVLAGWIRRSYGKQS